MAVWRAPSHKTIGEHAISSVLIVVACLFLALIGAVSVIAPEFIAKLSSVFLLVTALLVGGLARTARAISVGFLEKWVTILLAALAFWPSFLLLKSGGLPAIDGRRIVVGISLLVAVYLVVSRKEVIQRFNSASGGLRAGVWIVSLYGLWRLMSCFASPAPLFSFIQVIWEVFYYYSFYFLGYLFFSSDRLRDRQHVVILWLMVFIAAFACVERIIGKNYMVMLAPRNEEFSSIVNSMSSSRIRDGQFRAQGTFEHPLLLAEFSAIASCFAMAYLVWPTKSTFQKILAVAALLGALVAAYLSGSRSAYISLAAGLGAVVVLRVFGNRIGKSLTSMVFARRLAVMLLAGLALAAALVVLPFLARGNSLSDRASSEGRLVMLKTGLPIIEHSPIFGEGPGTGAALAGLRVREDLVTLDNYLLAITLESGIPALLLFIAIFMLPAWRGFMAVTAGAGAAAPFLAAVTGAMLAVLATRIILWMPFNLSFIYLFAGVALAQCEALRRNKS